MSDDFSPAPDRPVLVIGASGVDLVGRLKTELQMGTSTPARIRTSFGGAARNVAENLARLGRPVRLLTAVGEDDSGDQLLRQAVSAGIDVEAVLRTDAYRTGTYLAVINASGGLHFALDDMRAVNALTPLYIRQYAGLFEDAALVFVDANLPRDTLRTIISLARQVGVPVCADPASDSLSLRLKPHLRRLHMVIPNSAEAALLNGQPFDPDQPAEAVEAAKRLVTQGVRIAIITLAQLGVCYATSTTSGHISAIRTQIIDPTGAGDALTAAVLHALLDGIPLDDAMRLGVAAASLTLRHRGAVLPDLSLETLYDQLA